MADKLVASNLDASVIQRMRDMGDGSWAAVVVLPTVTGSAGYPAGATPVTASSGNVANAAAVATLPAVAAKTTYITGFEITGGGATAAALVLATLAGLISGAATYVVGVVAGATASNPSIIIQFTSAIPGSAVNTAIVLTLPALGAGNTNAAVVAHGFQI